MKFEQYIHRCFDLARLGSGNVSPNPAVGALLLHNDRIIGEGYHQYYGGAHAEVNAVNSVAPSDLHLLDQATLFVSLEPCSIHGHTPPCTDLILRYRIPRVVIAQRDLTPGVNGQGLRRLRAAGVTVIEGILQKEGRWLSAPRNIFVTQQRPYILLKWAQTANGRFARTDGQPFWITNEYSKRLVHKWRKETDAILIGTQTALLDDPALTTRLYPGQSPLRLVLDRQGRLPATLRVFTDGHPTWLLCGKESAISLPKAVTIQLLDFNSNWIQELLDLLYQHKLAHLTVEGGAGLLTHFIERALWDEARVFVGEPWLEEGITAPTLPGQPTDAHRIATDRLYHYYHPRLEGLADLAEDITKLPPAAGA